MYWETSGRHETTRAENPACSGRQVGESEHPEGTGRQVETSLKSGAREDNCKIMGDKCDIMQAENPKLYERQVRDKWEIRSCGPERSHAARESSVVGDQWETSARSCGPEHSEHPDFTGRPDDKGEIMRAENPV